MAESGQPCDCLSWDEQEIVWADVAQRTCRMQDRSKGWSTESQDYKGQSQDVLDQT